MLGRTLLKFSDVLRFHENFVLVAIFERAMLKFSGVIVKGSEDAEGSRMRNRENGVVKNKLPFLEHIYHVKEV